jgi:hypothetical protein
VCWGSTFPATLPTIILVTEERRSAAAAAIRAFRRWFIDRYGSLFCMYCTGRGPREKSGVEIHHIVPVSAGGSDDDANLVPLCEECHKLCHQLWPVRVLGSEPIYGGPRAFLDLCWGLYLAQEPERALANRAKYSKHLHASC